MMAPIIDKLAAETDVPVVKIDVEALPHVATRYNVNSIPTFVVLNNGSLEERLVGMQEKETLVESL